MNNCPMFDQSNKVIAVTVSKINDADNMGFGIPAITLNEMLNHAVDIDRSQFALQCNSCNALITEKAQYCTSCGNRIDDKLFNKNSLTDLAIFCEEAITNMGINPVLARVGYESWRFHRGSSEIRMFVYEGSYLFTTAPINILPKQNLEPLLRFLLSVETKPFVLGIYDNQVFVSYRVHMSDVFSKEEGENIKKNITDLAKKPTTLIIISTTRIAANFCSMQKKIKYKSLAGRYCRIKHENTHRLARLRRFPNYECSEDCNDLLFSYEVA